VLVLAVPAGLVPFLLVLRHFAGTLDWSLGETLWQGAVLMAGGTVGPLGAIVWSAILGCGVGAVLVALCKRRPAAAGEDGRGPVSTIRGPLSYAGPGSLGGTDSAIRR
jgi:hypothetical protein